MARCIGKRLNFVCITCGTERSEFCWIYTDAYDSGKNTPFPSTCGNPDCTDPHMMYVPKYQSAAQVRESQRTAVYVYPDGTYGVPWDNDAHGEASYWLAKWGGVRTEFNSIHELRRFQQEQAQRSLSQWQKDIDEGKYEESGFGAATPDFKQLQDAAYSHARNQVLEYDHRSLLENRHMITEAMAERRERSKALAEKVRSLRIGRAEDNKRYERLRRGGR